MRAPCCLARPCARHRRKEMSPFWGGSRGGGVTPTPAPASPTPSLEAPCSLLGFPGGSWRLQCALLASVALFVGARPCSQRGNPSSCWRSLTPLGSETQLRFGAVGLPCCCLLQRWQHVPSQGWALSGAEQGKLQGGGCALPSSPPLRQPRCFVPRGVPLPGWGLQESKPSALSHDRAPKINK